MLLASRKTSSNSVLQYLRWTQQPPDAIVRDVIQCWKYWQDSNSDIITLLMGGLTSLQFNDFLLPTGLNSYNPWVIILMWIIVPCKKLPLSRMILYTGPSHTGPCQIWPNGAIPFDRRGSKPKGNAIRPFIRFSVLTTQKFLSSQRCGPLSYEVKMPAKLSPGAYPSIIIKTYDQFTIYLLHRRS